MFQFNRFFQGAKKDIVKITLYENKISIAAPYIIHGMLPFHHVTPDHIYSASLPNLPAYLRLVAHLRTRPFPPAESIVIPMELNVMKMVDFFNDNTVVKFDGTGSALYIYSPDSMNTNRRYSSDPIFSIRNYEELISKTLESGGFHTLVREKGLNIHTPLPDLLKSYSHMSEYGQKTRMFK